MSRWIARELSTDSPAAACGGEQKEGGQRALAGPLMSIFPAKDTAVNETCEANIWTTQHIEESASYLSQATTEKFLVAPSPQKLVSRPRAAPAGPAARRMLIFDGADGSDGEGA